jgi:hypothetical protein
MSGNIYEGLGPHGPFTTRLAEQEQASDTGTLQPGDQGYWQVWGAHPMDIRPGDLVLARWSQDNERERGIHHFAEYEVLEMAPWPLREDGRDDLRNSCQVRFLTTSSTPDHPVYGSVGMLQVMRLVRPGTGNFLGKYVR